ncbi:MAG: DUF2807 domain-containing protein [Bacteroidia bacterium]|nr:DUF2807 domain-containing protein [Bacteroidia bacterium]
MNATTTKQDGNTATIEGTVSLINDIHIVGNYDAKFVPGDKFSYKATCESQYIEDLIINVEGDKLKAYIKQLSKKENFTPTLVITYPANYAFQELEFNISAGAKLDVGEVSAKELDIDIAAGANLTATSLKSDKADVNINAGATISVGQVKSELVEVDYTSGSGIDIRNIEATTLEVDGNSGASGVITGNVKKANIGLSSAATIEAQKLTAEKAELKASSGAGINFGTVEKNVNAKATTGGNISYSGDPSIKIIKSTTGGSIRAN